MGSVVLSISGIAQIKVEVFKVFPGKKRQSTGEFLVK
jgi:hypothetical protein